MGDNAESSEDRLGEAGKTAGKVAVVAMLNSCTSCSGSGAVPVEQSSSSCAATA